jgi:hypothetical protein
MNPHTAERKLVRPVVRSAYKKPLFTRYGDLAELTRTSSGNASDNYQPNCNHADNGTPDPNIQCS